MDEAKVHPVVETCAPSHLHNSSSGVTASAGRRFNVWIQRLCKPRPSMMLHILLAKSQATGGAYSLIHLTATPGFDTPYHLHRMEDEAFYVLDGEFTFFCGEKKTVLGSDGYIFLPRGVPHGLRCNSEKDSRLLIHVIPGADVGFVGMMLEMAVPARERVLREATAPDLQRLKALCEKNKIDILGPLPE
jgi:quercetin dioxygenase-like cupin family protein